MNNFKYLAAYSIPLACVLGLALRGPWAYFTPLFAFVVIPLLELMLPVDAHNLTAEEVSKKAHNQLFDLSLIHI